MEKIDPQLSVVDKIEKELDGGVGPCGENAGGILLMASSLASYITSHTLEVTGGVGI